ncbi:MAG TPA: hypothetical protein VIH42_12900 [Thermoguttaceae bacterium]
MAAETKKPENQSTEEVKTEPSSAEKSPFALLRSQTAKHWLAIVLIGTLVIHGIGLIYYKSTSNPAPINYSPEIALGNFSFRADKTAGGPISSAEFSLYITALDGLDRLARAGLASHQFRVQEEIEVLLRQAHSGDFDDPALSDLKRQIREQINQTLGNRLVSDVIITNLKIITSDNKIPPTSTDTAASPPWLEKTSSYISQ